MTSYTQLMALSQQQTKAVDAAAATAAAQLQRKLDEQRKAREAREAKEKELELRLRKQRLEEAQREEERQARKEQERQQKLKAIALREAQQREALLYGPKKAKSESAKQREPKQGNRSSRSSRSSQSPEPTAGPVLTREELREQKRLAEMRRTYSESSSSSKRFSGVMSTSKRKVAKNHLAGGAVPIVTTTVGLPANLDQAPGQSVKQRIAAVPLTLTKLNVVKRDVRTIDEILRDRERERQAANKVISGAEAKEFSDWFSKGKKKEKDSVPSSPPSRRETPPVTFVSESSQKSTSTSRSNSVPRSTPSASTAPAVSSITKSVPAKTAAPHASLPKPHAPAHAAAPKACVTPSAASRVPNFKANTPASPAPIKKRPRSPSHSPEPLPPPKKRAVGSGSGPRTYLPDDVYSIITGGRSRDSYKLEDEGYNSSDMEADVFSQEKEERISARAAKKEDEQALLEIKRHEEEKRRKRLQKERELASKKKLH